jgi:predicted DNA-binding protein (MmcQ/YjbR family)
MNASELREFCLSLPQSEESFPFGEETSVFKTTGNGKIFALTALEGSPLNVSLKVDPEDGIALRSEFPGIIPGYHLNKKHWITVALDGGVPDDLVEDLLRESHSLVKPKVPRARA